MALTPYRQQPRSTRIVVAYPRPAFSATKRKNHAPISFDEQAQVSQGHTRHHAEIKKLNTGVHGGALGLVKLAREPASSHPKLCTSLKNAPRILLVRRFSLALVEISFSLGNLPVRALDSRAQGFSTLLDR